MFKTIYSMRNIYLLGTGYCHATMDCRTSDLRCSSATHAVCMHHVCKCQPRKYSTN